MNRFKRQSGGGNWSTIHFDPDGRDLWLYFTTVASYIPTYEGCNPMVMPHNRNHHYKILYIYIHIPYIHTLTYIHIYILHIYIYHINLFVTLTFYLFISRIAHLGIFVGRDHLIGQDLLQGTLRRCEKRSASNVSFVVCI